MAKNSMGSTSTISCELPTYDMTLPEGRITASVGSTSYPEALRGSTLALDDSVLIVQMVAWWFFENSIFLVFHSCILLFYILY